MPNGSQALGVDDPHYLGPTIVATKDRAVRIVFYNLLPKGADGDLFLPTDTSLMGSGDTPASGAMATDPNGTGTVIDEIRNPMCTEKYFDPAMRAMCFTENRATLHLHGGVTPWISDGTPHQWITPANETTSWPQGVSVQNVPDMVGAGAPAGVPDCTAANDGCQTFYYTNEQSARLMFYHDHAWGITRLNVYAGEAAGYVLTDAAEQKLIGAGGALAGLGVGTPLVIQDRTFVPSAAQLAQQDPTWDYTRWGKEGDLWFHHVYMPAQNPGDPSGMSAYGRWMYGPWFWPPATPQNAPIANPYYNMDPNAVPPTSATPLATPCNLDVPSTWQYLTDPFCEPALIPGTPNISVGMEQFNDTPLVNGTAYPTTTVDPKSYRFRILNAANDRFWNLSWYVADADRHRGRPLEGRPPPRSPPPRPTSTSSRRRTSSSAPRARAGSRSGPRAASCRLRRSFRRSRRRGSSTRPASTSGTSTSTRCSWPRPSAAMSSSTSAQYAGKTLILYNDAPAAFPARVATYDYYTGGPDTGAGVVLPGYGPNTRTVMQVKVARHRLPRRST